VGTPAVPLLVTAKPLSFQDVHQEPRGLRLLVRDLGELPHLARYPRDERPGLSYPAVYGLE